MRSTLAAACFSDGRVDRAIAVATEVLRIARAAGELALAERIEQRLRFYERTPRRDESPFRTFL
jgi:hypothetical protein